LGLNITWCPTGIHTGSPVKFLIYINDLPLVLNRISFLVLFADDTSVIISNPDPLLFLDSETEVLNKLKLWFNMNLLFLNFSKTEFMKFNTKNAYEQDIKILYDNTKILNSSCIKFLGVNIANTLSWKNHVDSLIPKLSSACYAIRAIKPFINQKTLLMVYYAYFILLFTMALFSGATLHMPLLFFIYKRG
jgi:hypothetical protein